MNDRNIVDPSVAYQNAFAPSQSELTENLLNYLIIAIRFNPSRSSKSLRWPERHWNLCYTTAVSLKSSFKVSVICQYKVYCNKQFL